MKHKTQSPRQKPIENLSEATREEYISWLEKLMFFLSHKVRQPVAHVMGLSALAGTEAHLPARLQKIVLFMKQSALSLDIRTRELSTLIYKKIVDLKKKKMP